MSFNKRDYIEIIENALTYIVVFAMLAYGVGKLVQFEHAKHVSSKVSELTGMQLMWAFYGYSYPFVITIGILEVLSGLLLFLKRTRLIGGILATTILVNIILQDIYYDVNVGALIAAIIYQCCILIIFLINNHKVIQAIKALTTIAYRLESLKSYLIRISLSIILFIILRILEFYITTRLITTS